MTRKYLLIAASLTLTHSLFAEREVLFEEPEEKASFSIEELLSYEEALCSESEEVPSFDYKVPPCRRGSFRGGFLYWFARQSGLNFTNQSRSTLTTSDFTQSHSVQPHFGWNPGFELGADYGFDDSFWSFGVNFMDYEGSAHRNRSAPNNYGFFPSFSFAKDTFPSDYVTSAKMHWNLDTAILDGIASYEWRCCSWFSLIPSLALRDVWISERVHASYSGGTYNAGKDTVRLKSGFYGLGPLLGIMPKFTWGKYFSLYGEASASYLWGWFNVRQKETFLSMTRASLRRDFHRGSWNVNATVGLNFEKEFHKRAIGVKGLDLDVGFDYLFFTQQYAFKHGPEFSLRRNGKTLTLYGIHVSLGAHF